MTLDDSGAVKRGIYLRELDETSIVQRKAVSVTPVFFNHQDSKKTNPLKQQFELQVTLKSSERWITAPEFVIIASSGRQFLVHVDATQLPAGLHHGEVFGYDTQLPEEAGPLFRIPVTVCKPDISSIGACGSDVVVKYPEIKFIPVCKVLPF